MAVNNAAHREFDFADRHFDWFRREVARVSGIHLSDAKRELVYSRLVRRLRALGLDGFDAYTKVVERDPDELTHFVNALTTNLTSFFRESHHFDYLRETLIPHLLEQRRHERRIRIWSAGCSTGEEPYSLAMTLAEAIPRIDDWDVKILAVDIDSNVVATAAEGIYQGARSSGLSDARRARWFDDLGDGRIKAKPQLKALLRFGQLNLMSDWPFNGPFDAIFCRNVVIYFERDTQARLFDRIIDKLANDGNLFIGHSESLFNVTDRVALIGRTVYRKVY